MGFNRITWEYVFDFNSIVFPICLSENVTRYLYHSIRGDDRLCIEYEQFKSILNGEDRSQAACKVLSYLIEDTRTGLRIPPDCFDILSDKVSIETRHYENRPMNRTHPVEIHEGQCIYNERLFNYKYEVKVFEGYISGVDYRQRGTCSVVLEGDDFIVENENMHIACAIYDNEKQFTGEYYQYRINSDAEQEIWLDFQKKHKQELIDWLTPVIYRGEHLLVCKLPPASLISVGRPPFSLVRSLDQGYCCMCSKHCKVNNMLIEGKEHTKEWYELGLDKLHFKYICGDFTDVLAKRKRLQDKAILNKYKNPVYSNIDYEPPLNSYPRKSSTY